MYECPMRIKKTKPLTKEQEIELVSRARSGDEKAKERLVTSVIPMIRRDVRRRARFLNVDLEDAEQAGVMGLLGAIGSFDPTHGALFRTYAAFWWNMEIRNNLWKQRMRGRVAPEAHRVMEIRKMFQAYDNDLEQMLKESPIERDRVLSVLALGEPDRSLNESLYEGGEDTLETTVEGHYPEPDTEAWHHERLHILMCSFVDLDEKESELIRLRHLSKGWTLEEVAKHWGIPRQRVKEAEDRAFRKIRKALSERFPEYFKERKERAMRSIREAQLLA